MIEIRRSPIIHPNHHHGLGVGSQELREEREDTVLGVLGGVGLKIFARGKSHTVETCIYTLFQRSIGFQSPRKVEGEPILCPIGSAMPVSGVSGNERFHDPF